MKGLALLITLVWATAALAQPMQFEEKYVKYALDKATFKNCKIKTSLREQRKPGIHLSVDHTTKTDAGIVLTDSTRVGSDTLNNGDRVLEYEQDRFQRAWGPFMYQGDRRYTAKIVIRDYKAIRLDMKAWNLDFPFNRYTKFTCK